MNLSWTLRILRGPMRPFLVGKVLHRLREIVETRRALNRMPTALSEGRSVRSNIVPLPSAQWFAVNGNAVLSFARRMRSGRVEAYNVGRWVVGADDPAEVDVRSVHELSRMHHWCAYALAAHLDRENRDAWCELLEREIRTFTTSYPISSSVHWQFPMGTGIRLHSMLVAWDWARRSGWESPDGDRLVAAAAIDHALLTAAQRESRGGLSTSHYAANLLGILAAGCYITGHPKVERWKKLATHELCREIMRQILPDGMANEGSTGYHRQVTDTFVHAMMICKGANGKLPLSSEQHRRLALAVERCRQLIDLGMPLIGDNDDGLSMKLAGFAPDMSYLFDVSSRLGLTTSGDTLDPSMPDFGLYTIGDGRIQCALRNGPVGQFGKGGHAHNDQNSVVVRVDGEPLIVDPGSAVYTSNLSTRNAQRSVSCHSTMWWAGREQAEYPAGEQGLFWLLDDMLERHVAKTETSISARVTHRLLGLHERTLLLDEGMLKGHDRCTTASNIPVETVFVFDHRARVRMISSRAVELATSGTTVILEWSGGEGRIEPVEVSQRFAETLLAQCLRIDGSELSWTIRHSGT
ncbi:MAG: hypothetical protein FGM32_04425 [Candidatus Kapabacteria bacterium]|nr:hypothetical protein [Candidatus Kapabacteria bacterium]